MKKLKRDQKSSLLSGLFAGIEDTWNNMPWLDNRKKLRKSISQVILDVEKNHPHLVHSTDRKATNTPYTSSRNLNQSSLSLNQSFSLNRSGSMPMGTYSYALNPPSPVPSTFSTFTPSHQPLPHSSSANFLYSPRASPTVSRAQSPVFPYQTPAQSRPQSPVHSRAQSPHISPTLTPAQTPFSSPPLSPQHSPFPWAYFVSFLAPIQEDLCF